MAFVNFKIFHVILFGLVINIGVNGEKNVFSQNRIIGGVPAVEGEFPYQAAIKTRVTGNTFEIKCGGTVVNSKYVLTTAGCLHKSAETLYPIDDLRVVAGVIRIDETQNGNQVQRIVIHSEFSYKSLSNDLALIQISDEFRISTNLAFGNFSKSAPEERELCKFSGWGVTSTNGNILSQDLRRINVNIVERHICESVYEPINIGLIDWTLRFCTRTPLLNNGPCVGDEGGPLLCGDEIKGIASYVSECRNSTPRHPIFVEIYHYEEWIATHSSASMIQSSITFLTIFSVIISIFKQS